MDDNVEIPKETCPQCKGEGAILHNDLKLMDYNCPKCLGTGEVDWVEMVMGVKSITMRDLYNYCKEEWAEEGMMQFDFPLKAHNGIITLK